MKYLIIFLSIFLFSCGAKKLNKEEKKTDSIAKQVSVIKKDCTAIKIKQVNFDVTTDELTIEAKDSTKPIEIINSNGKSVCWV